MIEPTGNSLTAEVFDSLTAGSAARMLWNRVAEQAPQTSVFSLAGWIDAWHRTVGHQQAMAVVVVHQANQPVMTAAFVNRQGKLLFAGTGPCDYSEIVIDRTFGQSNQLHRGIDLLLDSARQTLPGGKWFRLGRMADTSATLQALTAGKGRYRGVVSTSVVAPHMRMHLAPDAIRKKSLKRHESKLKRRGTLEVLTHTDTRDVQHLLNDFFDQHKRRWAEAGVQSQYLRDEECEFVRLCCEEMSQAKALRFTEIRSDSDKVAFHLGFLHAGVFTWYKPTFDPSFAQFSPGEVLLKGLIERAMTENADCFDFTIGNEAFKHRFADQYPMVRYLNVTDSWLRRLLFSIRSRLRTLSTKAPFKRI